MERMQRPRHGLLQPAEVTQHRQVPKNPVMRLSEKETTRRRLKISLLRSRPSPTQKQRTLVITDDTYTLVPAHPALLGT